MFAKQLQGELELSDRPGGGAMVAVGIPGSRRVGADATRLPR